MLGKNKTVVPRYIVLYIAHFRAISAKYSFYGASDIADLVT